MKLSGRLRDVRFGLGGYKYQTNIRYLLPKRRMIDGYKHFVDVFTDGDYQYQRLKAFFDLQEEGRHVPIEGQGFGNTGLFLKMVFKNWRALLQLTQRMARFSMSPVRVYYALKASASRSPGASPCQTGSAISSSGCSPGPTRPSNT